MMKKYAFLILFNSLILSNECLGQNSTFNQRYTYKSGDFCGDVYDGEFDQDMRHGHGTYKHKNGDVYVGESARDQRHGQGIEKYQNPGSNDRV